MIRNIPISESVSISPVILWLGERGQKDPSGKAITDSVQTSQRAKRVVIVEDEMFVALHLETVLQDLGLEVCDIVATGSSAVQTVRNLSPDIVFMDINLRGDIDGVEAARIIRTSSEIPIVFITAYGDQATLSRINDIAPDAPVIQKPPMTSALLAAIKKVIRT